MTIPAPLFAAGIWAAFAAVTAGAGWLLVIMIREWRRGELW